MGGKYERITINAKDMKTIDFNINNNTNSNLYYGTWYEMVIPNIINDDIIIAKYVNSEDDTFGLINSNSSKKVTLVVSNNTNSNITINIGVAYSKTSSLNLPINRELITGEYGNFNLSLMVRNGSVSGAVSLTNILPNSSFENTGWSGCSYNTTYKKYGRCTNGSCTEIGINNNSSYTTGCGASPGSSSSGTCNAYNTSTGMLASTTGNIYGIYDMSGGAYEYVMGNMSSGSGSYTYYPRYAGSNFSYSSTTAKYIDTYAYGSSYSDQTAYNRARLGDATGEVVSSRGGVGGWYNDYATFVYSSLSWFRHGGLYSDGSRAGVFGFLSDNGNAFTNRSARAVLLAF